MKTKQTRIEYRKTKAGRQKGAWRFTVKAGTGETLATSEGYTTKNDAERGAYDLSVAMSELF